MKYFAISLILTSLSFPAASKNYALFFSGVDAEKKDKNQFLKEYQQERETFAKAGWDTQVLYGTPEEAAYFLEKTPLAAGKVKNANKANILAYLDEMLKNGESGDQLMMTLNGHGGIDEFFQIEDGNLKYSDPQLLDRMKLLNDKGIKLAVAMDTCFGGGAVRHLAPYACVVSSQTNNIVSYAGPVANSFKKIMAQTTPQNMNDYYLTLLSENTNYRRMVPIHSGSYEDDFISQVFTGLFRKAEAHPSGPNAQCYGAEAIDRFEKSISSIVGTLNATQKHKKVCKVFGPTKCKKQIDVLNALKKIKIKDVDALSNEIEALSDERFKHMEKCADAHDPSFDQTFKMKLDFKNIAKFPTDAYPGTYISGQMAKRSLNLKFAEPVKSGTTLTLSFTGSFCGVAEIMTPESINEIANYYAKQLYDPYYFKAANKAELVAKFKAEFKKSFLKTLTPDQLTKVNANTELIKTQFSADKKYQDALDKIKVSHLALDSGLVQQALAYRFINENVNLSEADKEGRKKCGDFKLK